QRVGQSALPRAARRGGFAGSGRSGLLGAHLLGRLRVHAVDREVPTEQQQAAQHNGEKEIALVIQDEIPKSKWSLKASWHRVVSVPAPGMAAHYTLRRQPSTLDCPVFL